MRKVTSASRGMCISQETREKCKAGEERRQARGATHVRRIRIRLRSLPDRNFPCKLARSERCVSGLIRAYPSPRVSTASVDVSSRYDKRALSTLMADMLRADEDSKNERVAEVPSSQLGYLLVTSAVSSATRV